MTVILVFQRQVAKSSKGNEVCTELSQTVDIFKRKDNPHIYIFFRNEGDNQHGNRILTTVLGMFLQELSLVLSP